MDPSMGSMEAEKMLGNRLRLPAILPFCLYPPGKSSPHGCGQGGILPIGFPLPSHSGIPGYIQYRSEYMRNPHCFLLPADNPSQLFFQLHIPGSRPVNPCRKAERTLDKRPA